ncbi:MAG: hypothetical protein GY765_36315 [bacterium]|nr:hypothetical protein [bacterium]
MTIKKCKVLMLVLIFALGINLEGTGLVKVIRDNYGVPHIYAPNAKGLFTTWGYVLAQDRLFQLVVMRATVWGKTAELYGPGDGNKYIEFDKQIRILSYTEEEVNRETAALDREYQNIFQYFAAGINLHIREVLANPGEKLPYEFHNLGITTITEFSAADIAQIFIGSMGIRFGGLNLELYNAGIYSQLETTIEKSGVEGAFNDALPLEVPDALTTIPQGEESTRPTGKKASGFVNHNFPRSIKAVVQRDAQRQQLMKEVLEGNMGVPGKKGSYIWAVSGDKTQGTEALFLNGPQMGYFNPAYLHEVGIHGAGYNAVGTTPVGYPFVEFGHNRDITWGSTAGLGDTVDIFILQLGDDNYHYVHNGASLEMESRMETIAVKGGEPVTITAYRSIYGPVFDWAEGFAYTRKRSWKGKVLESLAGWIDSTKATNFTEFLADASKMAISINWMYADRSGNIGYVLTGLYPIRHPGVDLRLPVQGTGEYDWTGYYPFDTYNPICQNPAQGFLANWNNRPAVDFPRGDFGVSFWNTYQRVYRIIDMLAARDTVTYDGMKEVEEDLGFKLNMADTFKDIFLAITASPGDSRLEAAMGHLAAWDDYQYDGDNDGYYDFVGYSIWNEWFRQAMYGIFQDEFGALVTINSFFDDLHLPFFSPSILMHQLLGPDSPVPLSRDYLNGVPLRDVMLNALTAALTKLETQYGSADMTTWKSPVVPHTFSGVNFNNIPSEGVPVRQLHQFMNRGTQVHLVRLVPGGITGENVNPPGQVAFITPGGEIGPHYNDQLNLYEDYGGFKKMLFYIADVWQNIESGFGIYIN